MIGAVFAHIHPFVAIPVKLGSAHWVVNSMRSVLSPLHAQQGSLYAPLVSRHELAIFLGMEAESLTRLLYALRKQGDRAARDDLWTAVSAEWSWTPLRGSLVRRFVDACGGDPATGQRSAHAARGEVRCAHPVPYSGDHAIPTQAGREQGHTLL